MAKKKRTTRKKATRKTTRRRPAPAVVDSAFEAPESNLMGEFGAELTGRQIVTVLDDSSGAMEAALKTMKSKAGVSDVCRMADFSATSFSADQADSADALVLDELGIAVIQGDGDRSVGMAAMSADGGANVIVEPEYMNYAFDNVSFDEDVLDSDDELPAPVVGGGGAQVSLDFLRGYQQALNSLVQSLTGGGGATAAAVADIDTLGRFADNDRSTWGLQATRALSSRFSGRGIRVAVLDTGMDLAHPDFSGRSIQSRSFIAGETVQDRNGHGTHCIGTSCGPRRPGVGPRYGIAYEAEIFAGKVLSNAGSGSDGGILSGINWAVQNGCQIVSMSLGRRVAPGERPTENYQTAGRRALRAGTLIIAAAGNDSSRPSTTRPVSSPANASAIAAVAALDSNLQIASFSNGGINSGGGEINFAGPGVAVHSSWPMPLRMRSISGTSMATPHVAGLAALIAQEIPAARGLQLYRELRRRVRRLSLPRADVGNGLAEAV